MTVERLPDVKPEVVRGRAVRLHRELDGRKGQRLGREPLRAALVGGLGRAARACGKDVGAERLRLAGSRDAANDDEARGRAGDGRGDRANVETDVGAHDWKGRPPFGAGLGRRSARVVFGLPAVVDDELPGGVVDEPRCVAGERLAPNDRLARVERAARTEKRDVFAVDLRDDAVAPTGRDRLRLVVVVARYVMRMTAPGMRSSRFALRMPAFAIFRVLLTPRAGVPGGGRIGVTTIPGGR